MDIPAPVSTTSGQFNKTFLGVIYSAISILPSVMTLVSGYTARDINYAEKSFVKLTPGANVIKLFCP